MPAPRSSAGSTARSQIRRSSRHQINYVASSAARLNSMPDRKPRGTCKEERNARAQSCLRPPSSMTAGSPRALVSVPATISSSNNRIRWPGNSILQVIVLVPCRAGMRRPRSHTDCIRRGAHISGGMETSDAEHAHDVQGETDRYVARRDQYECYQKKRKLSVNQYSDRTISTEAASVPTVCP